MFGSQPIVENRALMHGAGPIAPPWPVRAPPRTKSRADTHPSINPPPTWHRSATQSVHKSKLKHTRHH